jgi:hypothetical protein
MIYIYIYIYIYTYIYIYINVYIAYRSEGKVVVEDAVHAVDEDGVHPHVPQPPAFPNLRNSGNCSIKYSVGDDITVQHFQLVRILQYSISSQYGYHSKQYSVGEDYSSKYSIGEDITE